MNVGIIFLFAFFSFFSFGQIDGNNSELEKTQFSKDSIRKYHITSAIVYTELTEREGELLSGKSREYEFDAQGRVVYELSCDGHGNGDYINYGRGSEVQYSEYNEKDLRTYFCEENYLKISEEINKYDSEGNRVVGEFILDGKNFSGHSKHSFKWKNGEMIEFERILPEKSTREEYFDKKGRMVRSVNGENESTIDYEVSGDTLSAIQTNYSDGKIIQKLVHKVSLHFEDQSYYSLSTDKDDNSRHLAQVKRYFYDQEPLRFKF